MVKNKIKKYNHFKKVIVLSVILLLPSVIYFSFVYFTFLPTHSFIFNSSSKETLKSDEHEKLIVKINSNNDSIHSDNSNTQGHEKD